MRLRGRAPEVLRPLLLAGEEAKVRRGGIDREGELERHFDG